MTAQVIHPPITGGPSLRAPGELPSSQFASLLAAIQQSESRLDQRFADFKSEMKGAQEEAAAKAASRVHLEKPYQYKKKTHEEQAIFNDKLTEAIKEASTTLKEAADSPAVTRAKAALQEGAALLTERQKLIKIADRSANGWSVVAEYTADELAEDSDDEKQIEKAEKAAKRKAGLKRKKKQQPSQTGGPSVRSHRFPPYLRGRVAGIILACIITLLLSPNSNRAPVLFSLGL